MKVILIQLPVPKLNFGLKTGNIPLAAACLSQAADGISGCRIHIVPEHLATAAGDAALIRMVADQGPDVVGFTVFSWNLLRSQYLAGEIRKRTRAVQFTLVSRRKNRVFEGVMRRQVFFWDRPEPPDLSDLSELSHLDGVLLDLDLPEAGLFSVQDRLAPIHGDLLPLSFSQVRHQARWKALTEPDLYHLQVLFSLGRTGPGPSDSERP